MLASGLNHTFYDNRVFTCEYPKTAQNETCTCMAGFDLQAQECIACPIGTYKSEVGGQECTACPAFTTTFLEATSLSDCLGNPGCTSIDNNCEACGIGFYKESIGNQACQSCIADATTYSTASSLMTDCKCMIGNEPQSVCNQCPVHSGTLQTASTLRTDRLCNLGYTGTLWRGFGITKFVS